MAQLHIVAHIKTMLATLMKQRAHEKQTAAGTCAACGHALTPMRYLCTRCDVLVCEACRHNHSTLPQRNEEELLR